MVGETIGPQGNPPLILYSLNIELMRAQDVKKINEAYLEVAKILQNDGAQAIVICAYTPHMVYDFVQPKIKIPILHIADATGREAVRLGLKRLGLLGNRPTMTKGFIQNQLKKNHGIETLIPEAEHIDSCHHYVSKELTQGAFTTEAKAFFLKQIQSLKEQGADGIILGCTELPILIGLEEGALPLLATTLLHAKMAADFILSDQSGKLLQET